MDWITSLACVVAAWSVLQIMGNERQRVIEEQAQLAKIQSAAHPQDETPIEVS